MYSKFISRIFLLAILSSAANAEVVLIVHPSNNAAISKEDIKKIFMGRSKSFSNGETATPIELKSGKTRDAFLHDYLGKKEGELNSYWSRLLFTGKATPPQSYATDTDIIKQVASNPNVIGFIDSASINESVKVIEVK